MAERKDGEPFFAFLHLYEPHTPYEPPEPFKSRYVERSLTTERSPRRTRSSGASSPCLKQRGLYDRALIVFLSDHGEGLGEHGEAEHGMFLYREALQVPLLVKLPGGRARARHVGGVGGPLTDVFTTIGLAAGVPGFVPPGGDGLAPRADLGAPPRRLLSETFFPRIHFGWSDLVVARRGAVALHRGAEARDLRSGSGPGERWSNRIEERPNALRALRADLLKRRPPWNAPADVDPEARKKLGVARLPQRGAVVASPGTLDDPKDRIGTFETLRKGMGDMAAGALEQAHAVFRKLLDENPRHARRLGHGLQTLLQLGRPEEALAALKKTVDIAPEAARAPYLRRGGEPLPAAREVGRGGEARRGAPGPRRPGR